MPRGRPRSEPSESSRSDGGSYSDSGSETEASTTDRSQLRSRRSGGYAGGRRGEPQHLQYSPMGYGHPGGPPPMRGYPTGPGYPAQVPYASPHPGAHVMPPVPPYTVGSPTPAAGGAAAAAGGAAGENSEVAARERARSLLLEFRDMKAALTQAQGALTTMQDDNEKLNAALYHQRVLFSKQKAEWGQARDAWLRERQALEAAVPDHAQRELEGLHGSIVELNKEKIALREAADAAQAEERKLAARVQELAHMHASQDSEMEVLREALASERERADGHMRETGTKEDTLAVLKKERDSVKEALQVAEMESRLLRGELGGPAHNPDNGRDAALEEELARSKDLIQSLAAELAAAKQHRTADAVMAASGETTTWIRRAHELNSEVAGLRQQLQQLEAQPPHLSPHRPDAAFADAAAQQALLEENLRLKQQLEARGGAGAPPPAHAAAAAEELTSLNQFLLDEVQMLRAELEGAPVQREGGDDMTRQLQQELSEAKLRNAELTVQLGAALEANGSVRDEVDGLQGANRQLQSALSAARLHTLADEGILKSSYEVKEKLRAAQDRAQDLEAELAAARAAESDAKAKLNDVIEQHELLLGTLEELRLERIELKKALRAALAKEDALQDELAAARAQGSLLSSASPRPAPTPSRRTLSFEDRRALEQKYAELEEKIASLTKLPTPRPMAVDARTSFHERQLTTLQHEVEDLRRLVHRPVRSATPGSTPGSAKPSQKNKNPSPQRSQRSVTPPQRRAFR